MLRVTKLTDYASVVLTVLASDPAAVLSASELAERAGLEAPTVAKVLKPLAQAGLVDDAARWGKTIQAKTSGTQTSHINCSLRWLGTMPDSLRVRRRTRMLMAATQVQYPQTVAASRMHGRSLIAFTSDGLAGAILDDGHRAGTLAACRTRCCWSPTSC